MLEALGGGSRRSDRVIKGLGIKGFVPYSSGTILSGCIFRVCTLERSRQRLRTLGNGDQVNMIGHEAVAQDSDVMGRCMAGENFDVQLAVAVLGESEALAK